MKEDALGSEATPIDYVNQNLPLLFSNTSQNNKSNASMFSQVAN